MLSNQTSFDLEKVHQLKTLLRILILNINLYQTDEH